MQYLILVPNWFKGPKEFSDCPTKEGFVDIPLDAAAWLIHFKNQNSKFLEDPQVFICLHHKYITEAK